MSSTVEAPPAYSLTDRYETLIRVSQAISAHRDLKEVFRAMVTELRGVLPFDALVVPQIDSESGAIIWHFCEVKGESVVEPPEQRYELPSHLSEDGIVAWVFEKQEPIVIPDLERETRFGSIVSVMRQHGLQSLCMLPLTTVHRRIGGLGLASKRLDAYGNEDLRFLSLVASHTALAIDNAVNYTKSNNAQASLKQSSDRLQLLLNINNAVVSNLDLRDLFLAVSASIRSAMRCDGVGLALPNSETNQLEGYALDFPGGKGYIRERAVLPPEMQKAFQTGLPFTYLSGESDPLGPVAQAEGIEAVCTFPLASHKRVLGVLTLGRREPIPFTQQDLDLLGEIGTQVAIAIENALAYTKIGELKDQLARENVYLENEIRTELNFEEIVGRSEALGRVLRQLEIVAPTDSTVLIYGDTGTGKELVARAIHNLSSRSKKAFVKLNCAAIPTGLLESELFGHERGAFTGAVAQRIGRFELANQGTVFLDEIGEIPLELQPKLLRVLQEREFERLGSSHTLRTDARLVAATNRDLATMVAAQTFRADLYYRLNVFPLFVPPLRERPEDIPLLVRHFVQHFARRMNKAVDTIPSEAMSVLTRYHWPGNIRELQNLMERAVILSSGSVLNIPLKDLQAQSVTEAGDSRIETLEEAERKHILAALGATDWMVAGPKGAAALLGMKRTTLQARMEKLGIRRARIAG